MLDWIFEGIVDWVAGIVTDVMDAISGLFLNALGTDMTAMEVYFPFVGKAFTIMQYGMAVIPRVRRPGHGSGKPVDATAALRFVCFPYLVCKSDLSVCFGNCKGALRCLDGRVARKRGFYVCRHRGGAEKRIGHDCICKYGCRLHSAHHFDDYAGLELFQAVA